MTPRTGLRSAPHTVPRSFRRRRTNGSASPPGSPLAVIPAALSRTFRSGLPVRLARLSPAFLRSFPPARRRRARSSNLQDTFHRKGSRSPASSSKRAPRSSPRPLSRRGGMPTLLPYQRRGLRRFRRGFPLGGSPASCASVVRPNGSAASEGGSVRGSPCNTPARLRLTSLRPPSCGCGALYRGPWLAEGSPRLRSRPSTARCRSARRNSPGTFLIHSGMRKRSVPARPAEPPRIAPGPRNAGNRPGGCRRER